LSRKITRRQFMGTAAAAGAAALVGARCGSGGSGGPDDASTDGDALTFEDVPRGQVVLARADTPAGAVAAGVALMGGLTFIEPGQSVMLKPNMTGPIPPPDTTSCEVLIELVRLCREAGAGEVIVAERTYGPFDTATVFDGEVIMAERTYGPFDTTTVFDFPVCDDDVSLAHAIEDAGATFRPLDDEPWDEHALPAGTDFDQPILVPRIVSEVDHVINVPALKTHTIAVFTMSLKNLFGLIHPDTRNDLVHGDPRSETDGDREKRMFAQINLPFSPVLNVMDAIVSRTTGGPMPPGDEAATDMVLLSRDRVALDATGLALLRVVGTETWIEDRPVWEQVQLAEAIRLGIGVSGPDEITLVAENVRELGQIEEKLRET
jgi:uncharacterized protein (DUF362 family)